MHRRRDGRVRAVGLLARLRAQRAGTAYVVEDLSRGGAFLRSAVPIRAGTALAFELVTPSRAVLPMEGTVVRSSAGPHGGMGIAFTPPSPDVERELGRLLRSLATRPADLECDRSPAEAKGAIVLPAPAEAPRAPPAPVAPELDRLKAQICGLLMQLGEAQARADALERENAALRDTRWFRAVRSAYSDE